MTPSILHYLCDRARRLSHVVCHRNRNLAPLCRTHAAAPGLKAFMATSRAHSFIIQSFAGRKRWRRVNCSGGGRFGRLNRIPGGDACWASNPPYFFSLPDYTFLSHSLLRMDTHHRTDGKRMAEIPLVMHECVECRRRDPAGVLTCPLGRQSEGRCGLEVHLHPEGLV